MSYEVFDSLICGMPLMALDFGRKRIGVAFSNVEKTMAIPHSTVLRKGSVEEDALFLCSLYSSYQACLLVVGMPYDHIRDDGWVDEIEAFVLLVRDVYKLPVYFQDESYTTAYSDLLFANYSCRSRKKSIDKIAACFVLEHALDTINIYLKFGSSGVFS